MNTIILISLIAIALSFFIGLCIGIRKGILEGREETEQEAAKIAERQRRYALN